MKSYTVHEYINMDSEIMPYTTPWGFVIEAYDGNCPKCHGILANMKYSIVDYKDFTVLNSVGLCHNCKLLITCYPIKITKDNGYYSFDGSQWIPIEAKSWYQRLRGLFQ